MKLEKKHISDLSKLVDSISSVHGVIGTVLFGSFARGEHDQFSDYDLLVLFEDRDSLWKNWEALFSKTGVLETNAHIIPQTVDELRSGNPIFLNELEEHGRVLFARMPFEVSIKPARLENYRIIVYNMRGLDNKTKMRLLYRLYRKKNHGSAFADGALKLAEGCLLVPSHAERAILDMLRAEGASATSLEAFIDPREANRIEGRA